MNLKLISTSFRTYISMCIVPVNGHKPFTGGICILHNLE